MVRFYLVHILFLIFLGVIAFSAMGISGSLQRIAQHNERFTPPAPEGCGLHDGDSIIVAHDDGIEQVCAVSNVVDRPDGTTVAWVTTVGTR